MGCDKGFREGILCLLCLVVFVFLGSFVSANTYINDIYFTIPDSVFTIGERIELKGYVYQANYTNNGTLVSNSTAIASVNVNLTVMYSNRTLLNNYTFVTDSSGAYYSKSNYYSSATEINASSTAGVYIIRAEYRDANSNVSFSEVEIRVVNQTIDVLRIGAEKASYNPSETVRVDLEAVKQIGDSFLYVSNVTINGSLLNSTRAVLQSFSCTTGSNGKCSVSLNGPSTYGDYILEAENFKAISVFSVVPFSYVVSMKDDTGASVKNVFAMGEQARVEVRISNASSSDTYSFSGYVADSLGNSVKAIDTTVLNNNNSFRSSFLFTVDAINFGYRTYSVYLTVSKTGDGSISTTTAFQVQDWMLSVNKRGSGSGFENKYNAFSNKTLKFEILPTYRSNGSVIMNISSTSFNITLKDNLNNPIGGASATWNASCGKNGCYEFSLVSPTNTGQYTLQTILSFNGDTQTDNKVIKVINGVMSSQSTDANGNIKELFGTNEYVYFSLSAYNLTTSSFNLSDAEIFIVSYMNGSEFSYAQLGGFNLVNSSNSAYEWAWNSTSQRIKMDVPKIGGVYEVYIFGNNRTFGAESKFIVNPYEVCSVPKNTAGSIGSTSGYYYVWQFGTSDTIYFEIKPVQANNPAGKASTSNWTAGGGNSSGMGSACMMASTKQSVTNATITIIESKNLESGAFQNINTTGSSCQASNSNGTYTCTLKPLSKWEGGINAVKFSIQGVDGASSIFYSRFEARAFYLYGWSTNWQNNPSNNITLNVQMYEAGNGWWGQSSGLSGSVLVKRVEYQGRDGEWIWPPVDSGYNASTNNTITLSSSSYNNQVVLPVSNSPGGVWKTGYYRVVLQGTKTSTGETDYGYAYFGVKLWDVYGSPIECTASYCNYKSYFNSRENVSLYVTISKAGDYWWSSNTGGNSIYGNVTVGIKKIEDCRNWPCKELNSSVYTANTINVNQSSAGYWYSGVNSNSTRNYIIQINSTTGSWGTGYYSVVLDVNGTDTGYAWFNTVAFYVETQPTDSNGSAYKYTIRGSRPMYFNVTTTRNYKWSYSGGQRYNSSDYVNTTVYDAVLRTWDSGTYQNKEYNYPEDINITPLIINGNGLINMTYLNGSWPTGYYWGELNLRNSDNESSSGWLWFEVKPFRVQINSVGNTYNMDSDSCVNSTLSVYDSDWNSWTALDGNYSVINVYEDIWSGYGSTRTNYGNYSVNGGVNSSSFNATANFSVCPNSGSWSGGSWGGWHYLNVVVKDNSDNSTQTGWISFRTLPFTVSWNSGSGYLGNFGTAVNIGVSVNLTKPSTGASASGRLTKMYQWRYDNYQSTMEEYRFAVTNASGTTYCDSSTSSYCTINGSVNVTVYAPSNGWKVGYNYIYAEWATSDGNTKVEDWSGIYFDGRESYNGWYDNYDINSYWKYYFSASENITIKLNVRDSSYSSVNVNITNVWYAYSGDNCWDEWCRTYTAASFSPTYTTSGSAILNIQVPSTNWTKGYYYIKASVSGGSGTATITGGSVRVKDMTPPNITAFSSPSINGTYNGSLAFSITTSKESTCSVSVVNYDNFYSWYCWNWNSNSTVSSQTLGSCNSTKYGYNGSTYYYEYVYGDYHSLSDGSNYSYCSRYGSSVNCYGSDTGRTNTYLTTGGTSHSYTFNVSSWPNQNYGMSVWCYDTDWNYASSLSAFKINNSVS